jgi:hypothetical protein
MSLAFDVGVRNGMKGQKVECEEGTIEESDHRGGYIYTHIYEGKSVY